MVDAAVPVEIVDAPIERSDEGRDVRDLVKAAEAEHTDIVGRRAGFPRCVQNLLQNLREILGRDHGNALAACVSAGSSISALPGLIRRFFSKFRCIDYFAGHRNIVHRRHAFSAARGTGYQLRSACISAASIFILLCLCRARFFPAL